MQPLVQDMRDIIHKAKEEGRQREEHSAFAMKEQSAVAQDVMRVSLCIIADATVAQRAFAAAITDISAVKLLLLWYIPQCRNGESFTILTQHL